MAKVYVIIEESLRDSLVKTHLDPYTTSASDLSELLEALEIAKTMTPEQEELEHAEWVKKTYPFASKDWYPL